MAMISNLQVATISAAILTVSPLWYINIIGLLLLFVSFLFMMDSKGAP